MFGAIKYEFWFGPCVSVFNLRMRVCSSVNLLVLLEKSSFNITHSMSEIEWSGLLMCLATDCCIGCFLMIVHTESKESRYFTYVVA